MAGFHRGKNWLIRTPSGLIPRGVGSVAVRRQITGRCLSKGTPMDLKSLAQYFATPYYVVKSWPYRGVIPFIRTPGGRPRFSVQDVIELGARQHAWLEQEKARQEARPQEVRDILDAVDKSEGR